MWAQRGKLLPFRALLEDGTLGSTDVAARICAAGVECTVAGVRAYRRRRGIRGPQRARWTIADDESLLYAPDVDAWARDHRRTASAVDQRLARLRRGLILRRWPDLTELDAMVLQIVEVARRERRTWQAAHRRLYDLASRAFDVAAIPPRRDDAN